jgi:outer membrane protein assembly factor BamE (lipoprotein component of BamABCDE complex)
MIRKCWLRASALVVLALGVVGCASSGNEVLKSQDATAVNQSIIDGQTTREQVQLTYGQPSRVTFLSEKNEMWTYAWARASAQGQNFIPIVGVFARGYDVRAKELVVVFNEKNVVVRHAMTDNTRVVKAGLGNSGSEPPAPVQPKPPS